MKTTGAEWKLFLDDHTVWPPGAWYECEQIEVQGERIDFYQFNERAVKDNDRLSLVWGLYYPSKSCSSSDALSLDTVFNRWKREQATEYVVIALPKGKLAELRAAIKPLKGVVKK